MKYKVFISYKHGKSTNFCIALEQALKNYAKPLFRPPIKVFRDEKHLVPDINLPQLIRNALNDSEYLLLVASEEAASSPWVIDELEYWCGTLKRVNNLIIILTQGKITIRAPKAIDWSDTTALPQSLSQYIDKIPLYVDFSWVKTKDELSLENPKFKTAINQIAARINNKDPNDMIGEEIIQFRRTMRIRNIAIGFLLILTLSTSIASIIADYQRKQALHQLAQGFSEKSERALLAKDPLTAELLSAKGLAYDDIPKLRNSLVRARGYGLQLDWVSPYAHDIGRETVSWSPDGKTLASDGPEDTIYLWNADTGKELGQLIGHQNVVSLAWSPNGKNVGSASTDGTIVIWNVKNRKVLATLHGDNEPVWSLEWSPNGRWLASVGGSGKIRIWESKSVREVSVKDLAKQEKFLKDIKDVTWSPNGQSIAVCGDNGLQILEQFRKSEPQNLITSLDTPFACAWSPNGQSIAVAGAIRDTKIKGRIEIWHAKRNERIAVLDSHQFSVFGLAWSPNSEKLISTSGDRTALLWDIKLKKPIALLQGKKEKFGFNKVAWNPTNNQFATTSQKGLMIWDADKEKLSFSTKGHHSPISSLVWSPDGSRLISGDWGGSLRLWNPENGKQVDHFQTSGNVFDIAWHPNLPLLATSTRGKKDKKTNNVVEIWNLDTKEKTSVEQSLKEGSQSGAVKWFLNGDKLATIRQDGFIGIWQTETEQWKEFKRQSLLKDKNGIFPNSASDLTIDPQDQQIAHAWGNDVYIYNLETGDNIGVLRGHEHTVSTVAWSSDGSLIATGSYDKTVRIWNAKNYSLIRELRGHEQAVKDLAWSSKGNLLASGSANGTVRVWQPRLGLVLKATNPLASVENVAWSPDGKHLAAGTWNGSIFVWNIGVQILAGHKRPISQISWSPSGKYLASSSWDFEVRLWKMPKQSHVKTFDGNPSKKEIRSISRSILSWNSVEEQLAFVDTEGILRLVDLEQNVEEIIFPHKIGFVSSMKWNSDGTKLGILRGDRSLFEADVDKSLLSKLLKVKFKSLLEPSGDSIDWDLDWTNAELRVLGSWISVSGGLAVWNPKNQSPFWEESTFDQGIVTSAWSPDGRFIAARPKLYPIEIREGKSGAVIRRMENSLINASQIVWDSSGNYIACVENNAINIFDVKSGRLLQKLESQSQGFLKSVTWNPDGSVIASGATDGLVRVRPTGLIGHKTEPNMLLQEAKTRTGFKIQGGNAKRAPLNQLLPPSEDIPIATWSTLTEKEREPK